MSDENRHPLDTPWGNLIAGGLILFAAWSVHDILTELETGVRESVRINWIVGTAYETIGHWPTVIGLALLGAWFAIKGAKQVLS